MKIVPITRDDKLPAIVNRETDRELPKLVCWRGNDGSAELRRELTVSERAALEERASELRSALAPWPRSSRDVLEGEVALMLSVPANRALDETAAAGMVAQYLMLMHGRPHWAIVKVCRDIRAGKAGLNPAFCVTEAEFNLLVDNEVGHFERMLAQAQRVLDAKVRLPESPKLTQTEIEAKLGRPILSAEEHHEVKARTSTDVGDGNHAARVMADLAARRARRETSQGKPLNSGRD